jgi:catechol 2,3-dioxygenase-like lactoylglutathione lyase family enzyme
LIVATYPIVVTDRLRECREFYTRWFGLSAIFEASWIVVLSGDGEAPTVAFMHSSHPSTPPSPAPFTGDEMFLTLQVDDAAAEYETRPLGRPGMRTGADGRAMGPAPLRGDRPSRATAEEGRYPSPSGARSSAG